MRARDRILRYRIDLGDLVGGVEAIRKVYDGHPCLHGRRLNDQGKTHDLLNRIGGQEGEPCDPSRHDIAVITEDGQRLCCHGARGHVKHRWSQLAAPPSLCISTMLGAIPHKFLCHG